MKYLSIFMFSIFTYNNAGSQSWIIKEPVRFLALGDSYTIGQSVSADKRWPVQLMNAFENKNISVDTLRIIATTGWTTTNLLNNISNQDLASQNYNMVSLLIGVNDQYQHQDISLYPSRLRQLIDLALSYVNNDTKSMIILSIPDYAYTPFGQNSNSEQITREIDDYNTINRQIAEEYGISYFDITPISRQGLDTPSLVTGDGLHPSGDQYGLWVDLIMEYIEENFITKNDALQSQNKPVRIFPVPASDFITVDVADFDGESMLARIFDTSGKMIFKQKLKNNLSFKISTRRLKDGIYFIEIKSGKKFIGRQKIIISR